ncbi:MAG: hypothetical protein Q9206_002883 [Seirophora lacunosa]
MTLADLAQELVILSPNFEYRFIKRQRHHTRAQISENAAASARECGRYEEDLNRIYGLKRQLSLQVNSADHDHFTSAQMKALWRDETKYLLRKAEQWENELDEIFSEVYEASYAAEIIPFQVTTKLELRASTPRAVTEYSPAADPFERISDLLRLFDRVIEREEDLGHRAARRYRDIQQDQEEIIEEMREEHRQEQDHFQDRMRRADMLRHGIVPQTVSIPDTYEEPTVTRRLSPAKSHCCPLCRQNAFSTRPPTGSDTIQLLRVRQRLTDLAYAIFGFERTKQEERARDAIILFLSRRYADTIAEGEQEVTPSPVDCRGIFNIAQEILRKNISDYRYHYKLSTIEQLRIVQLDLVFANWELGEQNIPYFFDPRPPQSELRVDLSRDDMRALGEDPKKFFRTIRFPETTSIPRAIKGASEPSAIASHAKTAIHVDEDVEMSDAIL